jgi:hypothetical protein
MRLKKFNEIHLQGGEYENGDPHSYTKVDNLDKKYTFTKEQLYDFVCNFVGAPGFSIKDIEDGLEHFDFNYDYSKHNEGKAFRASKNPYGKTTKEDKKDQLRKAVEDHIKDKGCKTKKVGDDFEVHYDGEHVAQVMFRNDKITVKKQGNKFGKDFDYNQLGKIKAEITDIVK